MPFLYMLDTNTVSYILKSHDKVVKKLVSIPIEQVCISSITTAELLRGVAKKPGSTHLTELVSEFLLRVETLDWGIQEAHSYAQLKTELATQGKSLGNMDMLIAAHAHATQTILVTSDKAFRCLEGQVQLQNWS